MGKQRYRDHSCLICGQYMFNKLRHAKYCLCCSEARTFLRFAVHGVKNRFRRKYKLYDLKLNYELLKR